jgi:hypothetical protein
VSLARTSALVRLAPVRSALSRLAPVRLAPVRLALWRYAPRYPHPYDPSPRTCAVAFPMGYYCPGEDYHIHNGVPISGTINPESGKCEVKPGRAAVNATCPEGIVESFENGYCVMRQVQSCPEGLVMDESDGNCDNPNTSEDDDLQDTFVCPDSSDPNDSNGCRFRPGTGSQGR